MRSRTGSVIFFGVVVLAVLGYPPRVDADDTADIRKSAVEIEECFYAELGKRLPKPPDRNGFIAMYLFEQMVAARSGRDQSATKAKSKDAKELCAEEVSLYMSAHAQTLAKRKELGADGLAPLGTMPIESDSVFVEVTKTIAGIHSQKGHSDITMAALDASQATVSLTRLGRELVARASQTPDLYRWNGEAFHAHSSDYDPLDAAGRSMSIRNGIERFQDLLERLLSEVKRHAERGASAEALFVLGVASHLVQDLVYHRGMTMRQHSGLSYVLRRNPDFPPEPLSTAVFGEARDSSIRLLDAARRRVSPIAWQNMEAWTAPDTFDFRALARRIYGGGEDIGMLGLVDYWLLSAPYKTGRSMRDLDEDPGCKSNRGRGCWLVDEVLRKALSK